MPEQGALAGFERDGLMASDVPSNHATVLPDRINSHQRFIDLDIDLLVDPSSLREPVCSKKCTQRHSIHQRSLVIRILPHVAHPPQRCIHIRIHHGRRECSLHTRSPSRVKAVLRFADHYRAPKQCRFGRRIQTRGVSRSRNGLL